MQSEAFIPEPALTPPSALELAQWRYQQTKDDEPLFVVNNSAQDRTRKSGPIVLQVPNAQGRHENVNLLDTWIPQDLSLQIMPSAVLNSRDFKSLVAKKIILCIHPQQARFELAKQAAINEQNRLAEVFKARMGGRDQVDDRLATAGRSAESLELVSKNAQRSQAELIADANLRPNVGMEIIARYEKREISVEVACKLLDANRELMSPEDLLQLRQMAGMPQAISEAIAAL